MVLVGEMGKATFSPGTCLEESWKGGMSGGFSWVKSVLGFTGEHRQRALPAVCLLGSLC